ncbi:MAG: diguanylate cyclase [Eubacteriales bacterium]|nr:diguanylate cyclase [Eubacteriales bacterium]
MRIRSFIKNMIGESVRARVCFFTSFFIVVILCSSMIHHVWTQAVEGTREEALKLASVAEAGIVMENVSELTLSASDLTKKPYLEIKENLHRIAAAHHDIRFAYIFKMKDDKLYFAVDSEPSDSKDYSPPGQEYREASSEDKQPFYDGQPIVMSNTDRWGTWVSVLIPMKDDETGEVVAVFGIDYTVDIWYRHAVAFTQQAFAVALGIVLFYLALVAVIRTNISMRQEKEKLTEANKKLLKEEELFRTVYEQSPVGISINSEGKIDNNSMYKKIVGRSNEEITANGWESFTHPEDLEKEIKLYEQFKSGERDHYSMNKRYIKPDGDIVWANITLAPLRMSSKTELDYLCIVEDITERIKVEKELQESERSHAVLLSNLPGMAYRCKDDREWTMLFVSEGCFELTGYPSSDLINNKAVSFNDLICPQYRDYLWAEWNKAIKNRTKLAEEYELITASGEIRWVFEQGQAIYDEAGTVQALEGLIIDITDRKRKEEEVVYLNYHDFLTGIHNRRYLELEKERLDKEVFLPLSVMIGDINGVKLVNDAFGHAEGDILITETAKIIRSCCRKSDIVARTGGDEFVILMPRTEKETANDIMDQIKQECDKYNQNLPNEAYSINISLGFATKEDSSENLAGIIKLAEDFMYKRKLLEHKSSHSVILSSIKATMHEKSHETQDHADRLTYLSKELGKKMDLIEQELDVLELVATLHDIGKVGIDDRILNKPDKLNAEEWVEMKKHSEIGYRIAMSSPDLVPIADYILSLHEHWDGGGYPQGLKGEEIPLISRIVSVVDSYDAMTEDRAYRKAMSGTEAASEIKRNAGTQFDPEIAAHFLDKVLPDYMDE